MSGYSIPCPHAAYSNLPAFLVKEGGLNSGFMLAHCTAAALGECYVSHFRCVLPHTHRHVSTGAYKWQSCSFGSLESRRTSGLTSHHAHAHMYTHTHTHTHTYTHTHTHTFPSHTCSLREQGSHTSLLRRLHLNFRWSRRSRLHGWLCCQKGPTSCATCGTCTYNNCYDISMT